MQRIVWLGLLLVVSITGRIVYSGNYAKFTILSNAIIRMEWNSHQTFRQHSTLVFPDVQPISNATVRTFQQKGWTIIETELLRLAHDSTSSASFSSSSLFVYVRATNTTWRPSSSNKAIGQFPGTIRTLDGVRGDLDMDCIKQGPKFTRSLHCNYGIISKGGYTVIDDTNSPEMNENEHWPWVMKPKKRQLASPEQCDIIVQDRRICGENIVTEAQCANNGCCFGKDPILGKFHCYYSKQSAQDLYFFGHGRQYRQALKEYTQLTGKIPLPPRYAFGVFFSRYWAFNDIGLKQEVVNRYEEHKVPLDVLVIDMDWHKTFYANSTKDQAGQIKGWTGFTWDKHLFPNPKKFIDWVHSKQLKVTLNTHPASGIQPWEDTYEEMATAMGIDSKKKKYVPFTIGNKTFAENWFNITLAAREAEGVDFWWLDWQQGEDWIEEKDHIPNLNPTLWLNYVFFTNPHHWKSKQLPPPLNQETLRPMLLHRWGGLGNHRYQIGFSGDAAVTWEMLTFQPYFTVMAANVGYSYWSHDLGGHQTASPPELYTRWIQWGAFSPIFRTHCTKDSRSDRRIWKYDDYHYEIMRDAMLLRVRLIPYIYTQARITFDIGVGFLHGMYIDYPEEEDAYKVKSQYMFGESIMVSPVTSPVSQASLLAEKYVWIPPGKWVDFYMGIVYQGPQTITLHYGLSEIPIFLKAGSIIPFQPSSSISLGAAQRLPAELGILVVPGDDNAAGHLYEDDGNTQGYLNNQGAWTNMEAKYTRNTVQCTIHPTTGQFATMHQTRRYQLHFLATWPPKRVQSGEIALRECELDPRNDCWRYDGRQLCLEVHLITPRTVNSTITINVDLIEPNDEKKLLDGFVGMSKRLQEVKEKLDNQWDIDTVYMDYYPTLLNLTETHMRISYDPMNAGRELTWFHDHLSIAVAELQHIPNLRQSVRNQLLSQLNASTLIDDTKLERFSWAKGLFYVIGGSALAFLILLYFRNVNSKRHEGYRSLNHVT